MKFRLIVFDWDGTLMDSEARIVDSMQAALRDAGMATQPDSRVRDIIGLGLPEAVRQLLPSQGIDTHERVIGRYRHHYLGLNGTATPLFPGAAAVVEDLAKQGYLLAVATGKGRRGLNEAMRGSGLQRFFHTSRCADEAPSKPHPDMLCQIMGELGVDPGETLMIGDTEYDMQLAANAGTAALAVDYGVHGRERLLAHGPLDCLSRVSEIPGWLQRFAQRASDVAC